MNTQHLLAERFVRYAKIDTQSNPDSTTVPSTEKQKDLGRLLVKELLELGIEDAHLDEFGYVYATLPSNSEKKVPVICFCSHMDTSPDCSGTNVNPVIHKNYLGGEIFLPADPSIILYPEDHPEMYNQIGQDLITADGTTLLGADNKAGIAAIMNAVEYMVKHPKIKHGTIKILFTPDEEIGRGVDHVDMKKLGADYGYTIDGETLGHIEDETFSADAVNITFHGIPTHPGFAKGKMKNAIKVAAIFIELLPKDMLSPETTSGEKGFVHPVGINGNIEKATVQLILRDFNTINLKNQRELLRQYAEIAVKTVEGTRFDLEVKEQYRNMKEVLKKHPQVTEYAVEAVKRSGLEPVCKAIRGGTDGSRLSFMGLPCPNIFAGEHAFHSKYEWVSLRDMEKASETIIHLAMIWEEESK